MVEISNNLYYFGRKAKASLAATMDKLTNGWIGYFGMEARERQQPQQQERERPRKHLRGQLYQRHCDLDSVAEDDQAPLSKTQLLGSLNPEQFNKISGVAMLFIHTKIGRLVLELIISALPLEHSVLGRPITTPETPSCNSANTAQSDGRRESLHLLADRAATFPLLAATASLFLECMFPEAPVYFRTLPLNFYVSRSVVITASHISHEVSQIWQREWKLPEIEISKLFDEYFPAKTQIVDSNSRLTRPCIEVDSSPVHPDDVSEYCRHPPPPVSIDPPQKDHSFFGALARCPSNILDIIYDLAIRSVQQAAKRKLLVMTLLFLSFSPFAIASCSVSDGLRIAAGAASLGTGVAVIPLRAAEGVPEVVWISNYAAWAACFIGYLWLQAQLIPDHLFHRRKMYLFTVSLSSIHFTIAMSQGFGGVEDGFALYGPLVATIFAYLMSLIFDTKMPRIESNTPIEMTSMRTTVAGLAGVAA
ncbi:Fc.00g109480.m01.CDS01 [Cosmosporella sp. VM-42]